MKKIILIVFFVIISSISNAQNNVQYRLMDKNRNINSIEYYISPNGKSAVISYHSIDKQKYFIQVNDKIYKTGDDPATNFIFNQDGSKYAFIIKHKLLELLNYFVQTESAEYGPFIDVHYIFYIGNTLYIVCKKEFDKFQIISSDKKHYNIFNNKYGILKGDRFWFVFKENKKYFIWLNSKIFGPFSANETNKDLTVNTNKDNSLYWFIYKQNDRYYIQINENIFGPYESISCGDTLSWIGSSFLFTYCKDKMMYVNANNTIYGPYTDIDNVETSLDKLKFIFEFKRDGQTWVAVNGKNYGPYDKVEKIVLNKMSKAFAIIYQIKHKNYIRINNVVHGAYLEKSIYLPGYSHTIFCRQENNSLYIHTLGGIIGPVDKVEEMLYSADGKHYIVTYNKDNKNYLIYDDKKYGPYRDEDIEISRGDGLYRSHLNYIRIRDTYLYKNILIKNSGNKKYNEPLRYVWNSDPQITYDWSKFSFRVCMEKKNGDRVYLAQINDTSYGYYEELSNLFLSKNGSSIGYYYVIKNNLYICINGTIYGPYPDGRCGEIIFNKDGLKFALEITINKKDYVVYNGNLIGPFESAQNSHFNSSSRLYFSCKKDGKNYLWVENKLYGPILDIQYKTINKKEFIVYIDDEYLYAVPISLNNE